MAARFLEFLRYAGVAWAAAAVNYALFVLILLVRSETEPLVALVASSVAAMIFAYLGMRFAADFASTAYASVEELCADPDVEDTALSEAHHAAERRALTALRDR